ncbi:hypothetical protein GQ42DRAFT_181756 [Ramicandelaber brevisporus]|nr:hypothetical protein GQ42DRAFT_181756 [Ramicandelaber brevisporus]
MGWFGRIVGGLLGSSGSNSGVVNHEETSEHREPEPWIAMKDHEGLFDGLLLAANTEVDGWMMNEFRATAPIARHLSDYSSDNEGDDTDVYSFESLSRSKSRIDTAWYRNWVRRYKCNGCERNTSTGGFSQYCIADLIAKSGSSTQPDSDNSSAKERSDIALHKSATSKRAKLPLHEVNVAFIGSQSADTKAYNCKVSRIWRYLGGDDHIERGWNVLELNATASGEAEPITVAASLSNVPSLHPELHLKLYDIDVKHAVKPADIQAIIHLGTHVFADPYQLSDRAPEIGKSYHYGTIELEAPGETFAAKSPQNWGTVVHTPKTSDTGSSDAEWYRVSPMSPVIVRLQQQLLRPANANHDVQFVHTARSPPLQFVIPVGKRTDSKFVSPITVVVMVLGALHIAWAVASR